MEPDETGLLPVPVSALEHYIYCPRQCALIHVEQVFEENIWTLRGRRVHDKAHDGPTETQNGVRVERGLPLWSERLGLTGMADVVEFDGDVPFPVEYKHGKRKEGLFNDVQLCAQALCLEEMLGVEVGRGAIYHHSSRRRRVVEFTPELRALTEKTVADVREMLTKQEVPPPVNDERCEECSLWDACLPEREHLPKQEELYTAILPSP
ncbi:MAG: CRISPR-associated protein Cas4 [Armatimonadetes bacterium]|nr:CRISPR-associated protein Cas4 [Armatimonadota bacterium]